jgi:hypothetical protein
MIRHLFTFPLMRARRNVLFLTSSKPATAELPSTGLVNRLVQFQSSDLWPAVKAAAEDILYTCVSGNVHLNSGRTFESVMIEGRLWNFMVNVRPLMKLQVCHLW